MRARSAWSYVPDSAADRTEGRQEFFGLLEPEVAALLQAGAKAAMEQLGAGD